MIKLNLKAYFLLTLLSSLSTPTVETKLILMSSKTETCQLESDALVNAGVLKVGVDDSLSLGMESAQKLTDAKREALFPIISNHG